MTHNREVLLLTPGPTPIHPRALAALQWPMLSHMDAEVLAFNDLVMDNLKTLYNSDPGAFPCLLSGTGSLGMEAGLVNLIEPGDRILVVVNGVFGERQADMARRLGAEVHEVTFTAGMPVEVEQVARMAERLRPKLLATVHGETSTGVLNPVAELGEVASRVGALYLVDAVTTVGMLPFDMAAWGIDYAYTGSQKCLSAPPGVAPVAFSRRAMEVIEKRSTPVASWYCDVQQMRSYWVGGESGKNYHHTIPVQLHWATGEAIRATLEEGIAARAVRVHALGDAALRALETVGFRAFVPRPYRLPTVLALTLPDDFEDGRVRHQLRHDYGISITGGLGATTGRIWRLGLMGENARTANYLRLMEALAEIFVAPHLLRLFEESLMVDSHPTPG